MLNWGEIGPSKISMATLFVGPSKLLSNVKNVMCVPKWDMTIPEKAIFQKERKKKSCFTSSSTILMKIFKKIRETLISASNCISWTQGGGRRRLCHPPKVFFPLRSSCSCSCSCSESKCSIKKWSRKGRVSPNFPSLQISNKEFFFFYLFFFFPNMSNIAYWRFFPSWKQLLNVRNEQPALSISKFHLRQYFKAKFHF